MKFQITTLMENTSTKVNLGSEHGLSLLIEGENARILYDTGSSPRFLLNAETLGVSLSNLDAVILSHGHYDHTGGIASLLLQDEKPKKIYIGTGFFDRRYRQKKDGLLDISALFRQRELERAGVPYQEVKPGRTLLQDGVWLVSGFTSQVAMEKPTPAMLRKSAAGLDMDLFEDEVALVLEGDKELALISGCSHVGVVNMCMWVEKLFNRKVTTFVGGTHLMAADEKRIEATCQMLSEGGIKRLGACHCNGEQANMYFEEHFPGFFRNNVGSRITIE